jgi:predicted DCC family thiol-disulfide oxidoreductase YuxK
VIHKPILVYDGTCNLCITAAKFLHSLDRHELIIYVPYQMVSLKVLNSLSPRSLQGRMHLILENDRVVNGSIAVSEVCKLLFPLGFLCRTLRAPLIQHLYDWLAKRRYGIFGCTKSCFVFDDDQSINYVWEELRRILIPSGSWIKTDLSEVTLRLE